VGRIQTQIPHLQGKNKGVEMQDKIAKIIYHAIKNGIGICDYPSDQWQQRHDILCNNSAYGILALFKDYRNINEPIMRRCEACRGQKYLCDSTPDNDCGKRESHTIYCPTLHVAIDCKEFYACPTCKGKGEVPVMHEVECEYFANEDTPCKEGCEHITQGFAGYPDCKVDGKITRPKTLKDLIEEVK
jgi:hypothetical protein